MTPPEATRGRILIVEDDPVLLDQLTWALKERFQVLRARDATEGRRLWASDPDVYLFDMRLPPSGQVDEGLNLLRDLRQREGPPQTLTCLGRGRAV